MNQGIPLKPEIHKTLFRKKLSFLVSRLPTKPRLLAGALSKGINEQFEGYWATHFTYLHMLIKHLEILNNLFPFLLFPFIHTTLHLTALTRESLIKFLINWDILFTDVINSMTIMKLQGDKARMFHHEILNYLHSFVHLLISEQNKTISQDIQYGQLNDRTFHRLNNLCTQENRSTQNVDPLSIKEVMDAIKQSDLSDLEKNNLSRICRLMLRTGCQERSVRIKESVLKLISIKALLNDSDDTFGNNCPENENVDLESERLVLEEIESMLKSCIQDEDSGGDIKTN